MTKPGKYHAEERKCLPSCLHIEMSDDDPNVDPLQPVAQGHAVPLHFKAVLGFGNQTPHPIKIHRPHILPLQGGWQGDGS